MIVLMSYIFHLSMITYGTSKYKLSALEKSYKLLVFSS